MNNTSNMINDKKTLYEYENNTQDNSDETHIMTNKPELSSKDTAEDESVLMKNLSLILDIPLKMTVELGRTRMTIRELLHLNQDSIIPLEGIVGEPLDIMINGCLIARGEVVVMEEKYGVRIVDIIMPIERTRHLS